MLNKGKFYYCVIVKDSVPKSSFESVAKKIKNWVLQVRLISGTQKNSVSCFESIIFLAMPTMASVNLLKNCYPSKLIRALNKNMCRR